MLPCFFLAAFSGDYFSRMLLIWPSGSEECMLVSNLRSPQLTTCVCLSFTCYQSNDVLLSVSLSIFEMKWKAAVNFV